MEGKSANVQKENEMKMILLWLASIEKKAAELYEAASSMFAGDAEFSRLLKELGEDERLHYALVCRAAEALDETEQESIISMDNESVQKVQAPFAELEDLVARGALTKAELLRYITLLEFSELNGIFLYSVDVLKARSVKEVSLAAHNIEQHKDRIRRYLEANPGYGDLLEAIAKLPKLSAERILVVDSKKVNAGILKAVLETEGVIECAVSGSEALCKIESESFSAVIINLESDGMDGMEFYRKAAERRPALKDRFVFLTACAESPEHASFFKMYNLPYLKKPAPVKDIRDRVRRTLRIREN